MQPQPKKQQQNVDQQIDRLFQTVRNVVNDLNDLARARAAEKAIEEDRGD